MTKPLEFRALEKGRGRNWRYYAYPAGENGDLISNFEYDVNVKKVNPKTRSDFTGFCDKNGKKIYEGDILQYPDDFIEYALVVFDECAFYVEMHEHENGRADQSDLLSQVYYAQKDELEVIGNIWENPELIKEQK